LNFSQHPDPAVGTRRATVRNDLEERVARHIEKLGRFPRTLETSLLLDSRVATCE